MSFPLTRRGVPGRPLVTAGPREPLQRKERGVHAELSRHWTLDPAIEFLNHGSFGACPKAILDVQQELRARMERQPVLFLSRELETLLDEARGTLAGFVDA